MPISWPAAAISRTKAGGAAGLPAEQEEGGAYPALVEPP
jgi:hypothetical protein